MMSGTEETKGRVHGGSEEHKATGASVANGLVLVENLHTGKITLGMPNLRGWF